MASVKRDRDAADVDREMKFDHQALLYRDDEEFLSGTVPFVREGVEAGEPVLVAVGEQKTALLRGELNGAAEHVRFIPMAEVGRNPARIIPAWRDFVDRNTREGRQGRGIGEPIWPGRTGPEISECQLHESLLNVAFDDGPGWSLLCPYDTTGLGEEVIEAARHSHPHVSDRDGSAASEFFEPHPLDHPLAGGLEPPPPDAAAMQFGSGELRKVRGFVGTQALLSGLEQHRADDFVLAVSEVAANSIRHGGGSGRLRLWQAPGELICEVSDTGAIRDPLVGRRRPELGAMGGRGLWIVNSLCDLAQIRSGEDGTAVRLHTRLR
jgi:anti-sigma regulatory factor (Ser/Thr protein kinase)